MPERMKENTYRTSLVWKRPHALGEAEVFRGLGGVVAPVLAGFSLATIAALVTSERPPPFAGAAVLALSLTASSLMFAMQYAFLALRYSTPPNERLAWNPEATVDEDELERERFRHAEATKLAAWYGGRTGFCYNLALLAFSSGLILLLVPKHWTVGRLLAVVVAIVAGLVETFWIVGQLVVQPRRLKRPAAQHSLERVQSAVHAGLRLIIRRPEEVEVYLSELDAVSRRAVVKQEVYPTESGVRAESQRGQSRPTPS